MFGVELFGDGVFGVVGIFVGLEWIDICPEDTVWTDQNVIILPTKECT